MSWSAGAERELARLAQSHPDAAASTRLWALYRAGVAHLAGPAGRQGASGASAAVLAAFRSLYRARGVAFAGLGRTVAVEVPRAVRAEGRWVAAAAGVYGAAAAGAGLAAATSGRWAAALLPATIRRGLAAQHGHAAVAPSAALVPMLFFHNIIASGAAYAGGILAGLGAVAALASNGMLLGALAGWATAHGEAAAFWSLILPHGVLELPATFCAGGGGLAMGGAWLHPGERSRAAALGAAFRRTAPLFGAAVTWLLGAALIEGLFTPQPIAPAWKLAFAAALFVLFAAYLLLGGRRGTAPTGAAIAPRPAPAPVALHPLAPARAVREARAQRAPAADISFRLPEGLLVRLEPAGVPSRALALVVDVLLLAGFFGLGLGGALAAGAHLSRGVLAAAAALFGALFFGLYGFLFEWLGGGATPGKRALGLGVLREDGRPAGAVPVLVRNVMRLVDFLPTLYFLGLASAVGSRGARRLGDWAAGTVVVHVPVPARLAGRGLPGVPLPRPHTCGPLPTPDAVRRLPARLRGRVARLWRQGEPLPPELAAAAGLPPAGITATEHLAAALDRAGVLRCRMGATPPRDRTADLEPWTPGPAACERLPADLGRAVLDFWARLPGLEGPHRGRIAARLAERVAAALGAPGLSTDPDALVEHVAHVLLRGR